MLHLIGRVVDDEVHSVVQKKQRTPRNEYQLELDLNLDVTRGVHIHELHTTFVDALE